MSDLSDDYAVPKASKKKAPVPDPTAPPPRDEDIVMVGTQERVLTPAEAVALDRVAFKFWELSRAVPKGLEFQKQSPRHLKRTRNAVLELVDLVLAECHTPDFPGRR